MAKTKDIPIEKNDRIDIRIETLGSEGQGIGRIDGYAVFVAGALPGERVEAHVIKTAKNYAVAKLLAVAEPAAERAAPFCPVFSQCGGCTLQHLSYAGQLAWKKQTVRDALERIGHLTDFMIFDTIGMENPRAYRNKGSFPYGYGADGEAVFGFYAPRSHRLVAIEACGIEQEALLEAAHAVARWANENGVTVYDEQTHSGTLRHCVARVNRQGALMVTVVTHGALPHKQALIDMLCAQVGGLCSLYHNRNDRPDNVILGETFTLLWGDAVLMEEVCGLQFAISPASFLQVNPVQTEKLYRTALSFLEPKPSDRIADLYCGAGTLTLLCAREAGEAWGIENVPAAVENARQNAVRNGIGNAHFLCGETEKALPALLQKGFRPNKLLLDPPRKGAEKEALEAMAASGAQRIVYVSCDPATLARDCALLSERGYRVEKVQPVDMFAQTARVESVVYLSREMADDYVRISVHTKDLQVKAN